MHRLPTTESKKTGSHYPLELKSTKTHQIMFCACRYNRASVAIARGGGTLSDVLDEDSLVGVTVNKECCTVLDKVRDLSRVLTCSAAARAQLACASVRRVGSGCRRCVASAHALGWGSDESVTDTNQIVVWSCLRRVWQSRNGDGNVLCTCSSWCLKASW